MYTIKTIKQKLNMHAEIFQVFKQIHELAQQQECEVCCQHMCGRQADGQTSNVANLVSLVHPSNISMKIMTLKQAVLPVIQDFAVHAAATK